MAKKKRGRPRGQNTYTESFSMPKEMKEIFEQMRRDGYNLSNLNRKLWKKQIKELGYGDS